MTPARLSATPRSLHIKTLQHAQERLLLLKQTVDSFYLSVFVSFYILLLLILFSNLAVQTGSVQHFMLR